MATQEFPDRATIDRYADVLQQYAEREVDKFATDLTQELIQEGTPINQTLVEASFSRGPKGSILLVVDGDDATSYREQALNKLRKHELRNSIKGKGIQIDFFYVVESTKPEAQDPTHYYPGAKVVYNKENTR